MFYFLINISQTKFSEFFLSMLLKNKIIKIVLFIENEGISI